MKLLIHLLWIFLPCNPLVTARVKAMFPSTSVVTSNNHRSYINRSNNDPLWNSRPWKGLLIWVCCLQVLTSLGQTQWCACSHPALLCAVYPLQNQINVAAENELFLAWRSSDREGVRGFLCPPGCHAVKADVWWSHSDCRCLLVLPAGRDELWLGVRAVFFLSPYVPWCSEELGSDLMSMLRAWGYKACGNTLFHSLFIFLFLTLKPAGLLNSARFFQREKALLYFFMGTS